MYASSLLLPCRMGIPGDETSLVLLVVLLDQDRGY